MADNIPSVVSNPSGSATNVSREMCGWKCFRIDSRQLAIPCLHSQKHDRLQCGQDLLPLAQCSCPGQLLLVEPLQPVLPHFGQADPVHGVTSHLKGVVAFL